MAENLYADKAYRTISEVAELLDLQQHVLRFWETKFPQIKPLKRGGNRRYYRPEDVLLISALKSLLHKDGYTIRGVQKLFKEQGVKSTVEACLNNVPVENIPVIETPQARVSSKTSSTPTYASQANLTGQQNIQPVYEAAIQTVQPEINQPMQENSQPNESYKKELRFILEDLKGIRSLLDG